MDLDTQTPGQILRTLRLQRDWTLDDVADRLYEMCNLEDRKCGINRDTISRWERDKSIPRERYQVKLSQLYEKPLAEFGFPKLRKRLEASHQEVAEEEDEIPPEESAASNSSPISPAPSIEQRNSNVSSLQGTASPATSLAVPEGAVIFVVHNGTTSMIQIPPSVSQIDLQNSNSAYSVKAGTPLESLETPMMQDTGSDDAMDESRRKAAKMVAGIISGAVFNPQGMLTLPLAERISESSVAFFESAVLMNFDLYYTGGANRVAHGVDLLVNEITKLAHSAQGTEWYKRTLTLLIMAYQLQSCVRRDRMEDTKAHIAYQKSFDIATEVEDTELMSSALAREGVTLIQQEKPGQAIIYLNSALNLMDEGGQSFPVLKGYTLQALSEAYAKTQQAQECWRAIGIAETIEPSTQDRSLVRFSKASIMAQKGVDAVLLRDHQKAVKLIDQSLLTYDSAQVRGRARLIAQRAEAYYGLSNLDACIQSAEEAFVLARSVGSNKTIARIASLHTSLEQSRWKKEEDVARLGSMLHSK